VAVGRGSAREYAGPSDQQQLTHAYGARTTKLKLKQNRFKTVSKLVCFSFSFVVRTALETHEKYPGASSRTIDTVPS